MAETFWTRLSMLEVHGLSTTISVPALLFLNSRHISVIHSASDGGDKHNIIKIKILLYQLGVFFANFLLFTPWMEFFKTFL